MNYPLAATPSSRLNTTLSGRRSTATPCWTGRSPSGYAS